MSREPKLFNNGKTERYDMRDYMMYRHRGCEKEPKDFNTYTETGFYSWSDSQVLLQCDNRPCDELGMLVVKNNESTENPIIYHRYVADTGDVFLDVCISGVWSGWVEQATKAEFEELKKEMLQDIYTTDLSEEYKGVASDYGAEILKIEGKSEQVTTNGYQLFDASKLPTKTQGGATVTNNGDGSFTISGSGNLTESFRIHRTISDIKASNYFKLGKLTFAVDKITYPRVFFQLWEDGVGNLLNLDLNEKTSASVEITQDMLNRGNKIEFGIVGSTNQPIKAGTIKPMLYQDGDGTWEPFTGGEPSPNPNYPQEINNALDEPLVSVGRNFANPKKAFPNGSTSINGVSFKLNDNGTITLNGTASNLIDMYYGNNDAFVLNLPNGTYLLWNNLELENYFRITGNIYIKNKTEVTNNNKIYTPFVRIPKGKTFNNDILEVMFEQSEEKTKFTPCNYAETSLDLSKPLRSLNDGTCDVYENGVITRMSDYKEFDGSDDEAWALQSINSNGIANFNISISSSNQVAGSICNRFIFDKTSIAQATKEGYHLNDNNFFIRLKKETASTVEQFKEWLKEHHVRLLYKLPNPTTEKVELPIIPTFYPYTNIFQSDNVKAKIQYALRSKVDSIEDELKEHDHDDRYSLKTHNHDEAYAAKTHNHDEVYAPKTHTHDDYAAKSHNHDDRYFTETELETKLDSYALKTHNHDGAYAAKVHTHDDYALKTHSHDEDYAPKTHNHDDRYLTENEIDTKLNSYKVKGDFAVLNSNINLTNGDGQLDLSYPSGFNKDNCVCIAVGLAFQNAIGYIFNDYPYGSFEVRFKTDKITCLVGDNGQVTGPTGAKPIRIVLMKV